MAKAKKSAKQSEPITAKEIIANEPEVKEILHKIEAELLKDGTPPVKALEALKGEGLYQATGEIIKEHELSVKAKLRALQYGIEEVGGSEEEFLNKLLSLIPVGAWDKVRPLIEGRKSHVALSEGEVGLLNELLHFVSGRGHSFFQPTIEARIAELNK